MQDSSHFLLDTNIVVDLFRGNKLGKMLDAEFGLRASFSRCMISVITVGELLYLARQWGWDAAKCASLREFLAEMVVMDIDTPPILDCYAEIADFVRKQRIGDNDTWIAATAKAAQLTLLTRDKDFDRLDGKLITRIRIDPKTGKPV